MSHDLFTATLTLEDLAAHIARIAADKCDGFHLSFGMWQTRSSKSIHYDAMIVCALKNGEKKTHQINGVGMREMFAHVDEFFNTIKL